MYITLHLFTTIVYIAVVGYTVTNLYALYFKNENIHLKRLITCMSIFLLGQAALFLTLQYDWIINNPDRQHDTNNYFWLLFDWLNGAAMLAYSATVRVYLLWEHR